MIANRITDITGIERRSTIQGKIRALIDGFKLETMPSVKPITKEQTPPVMPRDKVTPMCIQKSSVTASCISVVKDLIGEGKILVFPVKCADSCQAVRMLMTPRIVGMICLFFFTNRMSFINSEVKVYCFL